MVIEQIIKGYLAHDGAEGSWLDHPPPELNVDDSVYAKKLQDWQCNRYERLTLALAMAPHLRPELLDVFFTQNATYDRRFTEFGGVTPDTFSGFLPTGQTLTFLICTNAPESRLEVMHILSPLHKFASEHVISLTRSDTAALPGISGILTLEEQWLHYFITGEKSDPAF